MINDIYYFINSKEREILRKAITEFKDFPIVSVCKKMETTNHSFKEKIVINDTKELPLEQNTSLFNKLAIDRVYEISVEKI